MQKHVTHSVVPTGCNRDSLEQHFTAEKDTKCPFSLPPTVNYKTSSKNRKNQTFPFPPMALLFITALLMSPDRRQSQSSRKFA